MTTPQRLLALSIDGRGYGNELKSGEDKFARDNNLVIIFAYSDDNVKFRGTIDDEVSCYGGGDTFVTSKGLLFNECDNEDCPHYHQEKAGAKAITAVWCKDGSDFAWEYETVIPHETFNILEDDEPFCKGIIFSLSDV